MSDEARAASALAVLRRLPRDAHVTSASTRLREALASGSDVQLLRAVAHAEALIDGSEAKAFNKNELRDRLGRWTTLGGLFRGPRSHLLSTLPERELRRRLAGDGSQLPDPRERRALLDALESRQSAKRRTPRPSLTRSVARISQDALGKLRHAYSHEERSAPKQSQPVADLAGLYDRAKEELRHFQGVLDLGGGIAKRLDARVHRPRTPDDFERVKAAVASEPDRAHVIIADLKDPKAAQAKADRQFGGDVSQLVDVVRGSVVVPHVDDLPGALDATRAEMPPGWQIVAPENRFVADAGDAVNKGPTGAGYRDLKMLLRTPEGWQSELQMLPSAMFIAKQGIGHSLYERIRKIRENLKVQQRRPSRDEQDQLARLTAQSKALYEQALIDATRPRVAVPA